MMAVLSGYGAVDFPYSNLAMFLDPVDEQEVQMLQVQIRQTTRRILEKKRLLYEEQRKSTKSPEQSSGLLQRVFSVVQGSSSAHILSAFPSRCLVGLSFLFYSPWLVLRTDSQIAKWDSGVGEFPSRIVLGLSWADSRAGEWRGAEEVGGFVADGGGIS